MRLLAALLLAARLASAVDPVGVPGKIVESQLPPVQKRGEEVVYAIYLPRAYDKKKPVKLILAIHGGRGNAKQITSFLKPLAEHEGAILAAPQGFEEIYGADGYWWRVNREEIKALTALQAHVLKHYNVDRAQVSLIGLADGGELGLKWAMGKDRGLSGIVLVNILFKKPRTKRAKKTMRIYVAACKDAHEKTEKLAEHAERAYQALRMMRYPIVRRIYPGSSKSFFYGWENEFHKAYQWFADERNWTKEIAQAELAKKGTKPTEDGKKKKKTE